MKEKRFTAIHVILIALSGVLVTLLVATGAVWSYLGPGGFTMLQGLHLITDRFVGDYTPEQVLDGTMDGMVTSLGDRWSYYLNPQQFQDQIQRRTNTYVGIGVTVTFGRDEGLLVQSIEQGSSAEEAGIVPGDVIVAVDGKSIAGDGKEQGAELIRGEAGTDVTVDILGADGAARTVTVRRKNMETHPVSFKLLQGDVGYVQLKNFYARSADEMKKAVEALQEQGAKSLLFDMRGNPGGYLPELTTMLDYLLPEGPIFASHTKDGPTQITQSDAAHVDLPMAVLVNGDSYSAAELFAGQLHESVGAPIVGEPTSGKGYSQQSFALPNGGAMGISTGAYTTGGGVSLVGVGLIPDVALENTGENDAQLEAARALLVE